MCIILVTLLLKTFVMVATLQLSHDKSQHVSSSKLVITIKLAVHYLWCMWNLWYSLKPEDK